MFVRGAKPLGIAGNPDPWPERRVLHPESRGVEKLADVRFIERVGVSRIPSHVFVEDLDSQDEASLSLQNPVHLSQCLERRGHVVQRIRAEDEVEGRVLEGERLCRRLSHQNVGRIVVEFSVGIGQSIDADTFSRQKVEDRRDPAADVENPGRFRRQLPHAVELPIFTPVVLEDAWIPAEPARPYLLEQKLGIPFVDEPEQNCLHERDLDQSVSHARGNASGYGLGESPHHVAHRPAIYQRGVVSRRSGILAAGQSMRRKLSIVTPVYNEREHVVEFVRELVAVLDTLPFDYEIIAVDDGSAAETAKILDELCARYPGFAVVHLSRNFGHQAALTAGLDLASGDAVIMMDSDLEHPPALIPRMVELWNEGYDLVYAVRERTQDLPFLKRLTSRAYYRVLNAISETPVPADAADFRLVSRQVAEALRGLRERTRFLRGLTTWLGFRQIGIPYRPVVRRPGPSTFTLRRMARLGADGILSMSTVPLRLSLTLGFLMSLASLGYMVYIVIAYFASERAVAGWSSIIVAVLFLGGLQLSVTGLVGLYIANIYAEVKQRPLYVIRERRGHLQGGDGAES